LGLFLFNKYLRKPELSVSKQFTLGKTERLKSRKQIEQLFNVGKNFGVNPFRVYFMVNSPRYETGGDPMAIGRSMTRNRDLLQFGVGVSSRNFKRAVDRNRIKRLTREAWRLQKDELLEKLKGGNKHLNIFFIYTSKELPDFVTVKDKVAVALKKLIDKLNENDSADP
jgi:ribonuclease P protein component